MPVVKKLYFSYYKRHKPESELFYKTVMAYWPKFLEEQRKINYKVPVFIQNEFENYLACGIPENGFVRTYCYTCRLTGIVAFSCKQRGFCPSCCARRMNDEASHLVDHVLPQVKYRQWVLSFPYKLRYAMAYDSELTNEVLSVFIKVISKYYKKKFKIFFDSKAQLKKLKTGSVTFIQRFGSALNLNVHFHTLFADGVFEKAVNVFENETEKDKDKDKEDIEYSFQVLNELTQEDLYQLTEKIKIKVQKILSQREIQNSDQLFFDENSEELSLNKISKASMTHQSLFGERAGKGVRRFGDQIFDEEDQSQDRFSYNNEGFSLNARVVIKSGEDKKLEKLLRYMGRGPVATKRLTEYYPNGLLYELKTPWKDGTTHMNFTPLDFISRLVSLIPPAGMNMIRYHGVFAPNFKDRNLIVLGYDDKNEESSNESQSHSQSQNKTSPHTLVTHQIEKASEVIHNDQLNKESFRSFAGQSEQDKNTHKEEFLNSKLNLNQNEINLNPILDDQKEKNHQQNRFIEIISTTQNKNIFQMEKEKRNKKRERMRWAEMLKRTFEVDVTTCQICRGRIEQIAVIKDRVVAKAILKSLYETSVLQPIKLDEDRGPPDSIQLFSDFFDGSMMAGFDESLFNQTELQNDGMNLKIDEKSKNEVYEYAQESWVDE